MIQKHFIWRMFITWRERWQSVIDNEVTDDQMVLDALKGCGLLKKFNMPNTKENIGLLKMLIHYWDLEKYAFIIEQMHLRVEIEDAYFIIGLSWRGKKVNLMRRTRGRLNVEDYVYIYYLGNTEKIGTQIPINHVERLALRIILFTIARVNGLASLHQTSQVLMSLAVEFLTNFFDWCTPLLTNMKKQLTSIRKGPKKTLDMEPFCAPFSSREYHGFNLWYYPPLSTRGILEWGIWDNIMKRIGANV